VKGFACRWHGREGWGDGYRGGVLVTIAGNAAASIGGRHRRTGARLGHGRRFAVLGSGGLESGRAQRSGTETGRTGAADRPARSCGRLPSSSSQSSTSSRPSSIRRIPVDIYELGLIYEIIVDSEKRALINMTLTSPACPVCAADSAGSPVQGESGARHHGSLGGDRLEPPWSKDRMSEVAKLTLGMFLDV
jgi:hypothetical protein